MLQIFGMEWNVWNPHSPLAWCMCSSTLLNHENAICKLLGVFRSNRIIDVYVVPLAGYALTACTYHSPPCSSKIKICFLLQIWACEPLLIICMNYYHNIVRDCNVSEAHLWSTLSIHTQGYIHREWRLVFTQGWIKLITKREEEKLEPGAPWICASGYSVQRSETDESCPMIKELQIPYENLGGRK